MSDHRPAAPQPGDRPPSAAAGGPKLDRPPSDRYRPAPLDPAMGSKLAARRASAAGPIGAAVVVAIAGAFAIAFILGIILATTGTFVVCLLAGAAIGLLVAGATVGPAPAISRGVGMRVAVGLALGMIVLAGAATWVLARSEGGVMDPLTYLWTTFGFGIPVQAVVALLAAAWGAASGPIRWRE